MWTVEAACARPQQVGGQAPVLRSVMERLGSPLGLALGALKALRRCLAATLSGLGSAFLLRCGAGHGVGLHSVGCPIEDVETTMT